jgi:hypothetical protein
MSGSRVLALKHKVVEIPFFFFFFFFFRSLSSNFADFWLENVDMKVWYSEPT